MLETDELNILLADDDKDDCKLFQEALEELGIGAKLTTIHDGEELMRHLESVSANLPYALFLDLNMPRKNGFECLSEIQTHATFKNLPVIIISTSYDEEKVNQLYNKGAKYYICKPSDFEELKNVLNKSIMLVKENYIR